MTWNFHGYFTNRTDGLIGKLKLDDAQIEALKELRQRVRVRTRDVFTEAKLLVQENKTYSLSLENFNAKFGNTRLKHLSQAEQQEVALLIRNMDEQTREAFAKLSPRFWTQGSFQYDTLNCPYVIPPQEMDIDDGTYLPMAIFEDKPVIGHRLLMLLVDSSLKSLVAENPDWQFEAKRTCARIKIPAMHTHIDVPMYAIPEDQFKTKEVALSSMRKAVFESYDSFEILMSKRADYSLDSNSVNLAIREGEQRWVKSDPKIVEDWFYDSCQRIGRHLRKICRFIKSWRDAQWNSGGPSSISLMAATVNILDCYPHDKNDLGATMKLIAEKLPGEFLRGVESPDHTDDKLLFPPQCLHGEREKEVMSKLNELERIFSTAENAPTKQEALKTMNKAFGHRVTLSELIVGKQSAPAFKHEPSIATQAKRINPTMASG